MNLDELLGALSVDQLQDMAAAWAPDEPASRSKLELFRILRDKMVRPECAVRCLEHCGRLERGIARKLLRSANVSQSVAVLAASASERPRSLDDTRAAVAELVAMGLACVEPEKRWEAYGSARVTIADELIGPLREATGIDDRLWTEVLGLAGHLEARPGDESAGLLAEPAACAERLATLPEPLKGLVLAGTRLRAGIVPVKELSALGVELPEIDDALLDDWRRQLEAALIGTIGDVSLLDYGIALDGKVLAVFGEVVEALLGTPCDGKTGPVDPVGPDFLLDLSELISTVRETGSKLKASGELTAAACNRIIAKMNRAELPQMDAHELLDLRVVCAEKLGLVERGESLIVRRSAWQWEQRSFEEKASDLFGLIGFAGPAARSKHHHDGLCETALGLLQAMTPGEWRQGGALAGVALRRYLAALESTELREQISRAVHDVDEYVLPPFPGVGQLAADLHRSVVMEAYALGVLDLLIDGGRIVGESLSDFGAVATRKTTGHVPPAKLITMPDFEVIILPENDTTRLRYDVGQFAASEKFERTYHMRITKERVEEAVVRGLTADDMVRVLRDHSDTGSVTQNVEASIRGWAERVRVAMVEDVYVFELPDEELLNVIAELPELKKLIVRRVSPTALALSERPTDRRLLTDLCRLGVYVR